LLFQPLEYGQGDNSADATSVKGENFIHCRPIASDAGTIQCGFP
jgi:hypothetical protein